MVFLRKNMTPYVELQVTSNYSFLRGASHAHELAHQAKVLGHEAIAIADRNTLAGAARMFVACREHGIRLIVGTRLELEDGPDILCFPQNRAAYGRLSQLLTLGKRRAEKGECHLFRGCAARRDLQKRQGPSPYYNPAGYPGSEFQNNSFAI